MTVFQITTVPQDGRTRIEVLGELDIASAPKLERELSALIAEPGPELALDLRGVTFIDSSGLRAVLVGNREAAAAGRRLVVIPGDGQVQRVIEMARVTDHLDLGDGA